MKGGVQEVGIPLTCAIKHGTKILAHCGCFNCIIAAQLHLERTCAKCILSKMLGMPKPDEE